MVRLQDRVAQSTQEAEYLCLTPAANQITTFRELSFQIGIVYYYASPIYCDNQSAILTANNPAHRGRSRHIPIRYHLIKEIRGYGVIELIWIPSDLNISDIGTKFQNVTLFILNNDRIYNFRSFKIKLPFGDPVETKPINEYV